MSGERSERPADLAQVAADEALLTALGGGSPAPDEDDLAGLLAAWRADLDTDLPDFELPTFDDLDDPLSEETVQLPVRRRRGTRLTRLLTGVAAALLLLAGLAVGAGRAGPDSPLWPLTRVMYPEQADVRAAQHEIAAARSAARAGQVDEARRHLDQATGLVDQIRDQAVAKRLRDEIAEVRRMLDAAVTPGVTSTPTAPPSVAPTPTPSVPPGGAGQTGGPGGGATTPGGGGILPTLPPIVPTLPLPTPKLPLPSLPGLPLPSLPVPLPSLPIEFPR